MEKSCLTFCARSTGADLAFTVRFDGEVIYHNTGLGQDLVEISHEFDDSNEIEHCVEFELSGKQLEHTEVDAAGEITQDRVIEIQAVRLDDIELGYLFNQVAEYHHDGNGGQDPVVEKFYNTMGCNGVVRFRFSSPLYLWLLEHM